MDEPFERSGVWWRRGEDGWLRWDPLLAAWVPQAAGPDDSAKLLPAPRLPEFAPLQGHMRGAIGFLAAAVVFDGVAVLSGFEQYVLIGRLAEGAASPDDLAQNDARQAAVAALQLGLLLVAAVAFLRWFRRAYDNLPSIAWKRRYGAGWAVGAWFVPLLNLIRPKQIADELWRAGAPDPPTASVPLYVHLWWASFLVASFVGNLAGRTLFLTGEVETLRTAAGWLVFSDALSVVAGLLLIRFVREATARLTARRADLVPSSAQARAVGPPPSQPPA